MGIVIAILGAILAIFCVVIIHEFGHFIVARWMGIRILRFSIGFGKPLWLKTTKQGTEFAIAWLPLGGYVRMLGEGDDATPKDMKAFSYNNKNVFQRMVVILAGPAMNFVFAAVLYWILFLPGVVHIKPIVGAVKPHSIAAHAGLKPMDHIITVNNKSVKNWQAVIMEMMTRIGNKQLIMTVTHPPSTAIRRVTLPIANWKINEQKPQFFQALGISPHRPKFPMVIGRIVRNLPAARSGLQQGDRLLSVNGKQYTDMIAVIKLIRKHPGKTMQFTILRNGQQKRVMVKVGVQKTKSIGHVGFAVVMPKWPPSMLTVEKYSVLSAWKPAIIQTGSLIRFNAIVLGKMLSRKISMRSLGGPISIFQMAGQASRQNYRVYLGFLAFLSVALGFINLLPIPGLDGGHFVFQVIEVIFRRPVPLRIQALCLRIGLFLLIFLILNASINDLIRLFSLN